MTDTSITGTGPLGVPDGRHLPDNPYLLLTPGPLSTSKSVKAAMLRDWCTWDTDYKSLVQDIRRRVVDLACPSGGETYTTVLMQGSGTFSVEAVLGSVVPSAGRLLILANGAYGRRLAEIARVLQLNHRLIDFGDVTPVDPCLLAAELDDDAAVTHVAFVHCETTTGLLNPLSQLARVVSSRGRVLIVDAMSSFGGVPLDMVELGIDFLISSANKCIQGVPGFGLVVARRTELRACAGWARSLSLDLHAQWETMEMEHGKWRFTSPTHTVRAFHQALRELEAEGGVSCRWARYQLNHATLVQGMRALGFETLLDDELQSPIITTFRYPSSEGFGFSDFYDRLKKRGFVIYPGKLSDVECFRVGTIGTVFPEDMKRLVSVVAEERFW